MRIRLLEALRIQSFRSRLMLSAIACILIPTMITLIMSNYLAADEVREQAMSNANQSLQLIDGSVSNVFKFMLYVENYILLDDSEIGYVLKNRAFDLDYSDNQSSDKDNTQFFENQMVINKLDNLTVAGEQCKITIILPNGKNFTNYAAEEVHPSDWKNQIWFANLKDLKGYDTYWVPSEPTLFKQSRDHHPYQISVARTLQTTNSKIYAYVIVTIYEDQIHSLFGNGDGGQQVMMVDDKGVIQSSSDTNLVGTKFEHDSNDSSIVVKNGIRYLLTERKLTYSNWKLISLTPYKRAISNITSIYSHVLMYYLLFFIVFLLIQIYLIGKFTGPLRQLGKVAKTVNRGNLDVRSNIQGADEIGMLGLSFDQMLESIKHKIMQITYEQTQKRKAELAMLQAQIRPHFLFNVLNSIRLRILLKGDSESAEIIGSLSKLLRMTFERDKGDITLIEEMRMSEDYVRLMNMRQGEDEKVNLNFVVEQITLSKRVPRFILQPLIENAIIHGFSGRGGSVNISTGVMNGGWCLTVCDDGKGMEPEVLEKVRKSLEANESEIEEVPVSGNGFSSIGITNVYDRLRLTYGERFSMKIGSSPESGTCIRMSIPDKEIDSYERYASG